MEKELLRFFQDAEFVQGLANIDYVLWLAAEGYLQEKSFCNFLEYLLYLQEPEFAVHLSSFPRGIQVLELLTQPAVRHLLHEDPMQFRRILGDQLWASWARTHEYVAAE